MAALTLAIDNPAATKRSANGFVSVDRMTPTGAASPARLEGVALRPGEGSDLLLALLSRAHLMIERIAARRRAANIARNRVETRRQLAKLPAWVGNDLLHEEQKVITSADKTVLVERQQIPMFDE
ncbi:MAG TPA: hypothetical protein VD840_03245 [Sinorhizobium sp.]|nr:hypothetical protein [Sinorhizobium sp.]